jgi:Tfp pilus assembly protein PilW
MSALRSRLAGCGGEAGLTLVELLVAASMSVILVGAAGSMLISAVKSQPRISERAQNVSKARYVLERMTREIRNGTGVEQFAAEGTSVTFDASVRRAACGAGVQEDPAEPAIRCEIAYSCEGSTCTRTESDPEGVGGGTTTTVVSGLAGDQVFSREPPSGEITYIGVSLKIPDPEGPGELSVSDGATLRTTLLNQQAIGE